MQPRPFRPCRLKNNTRRTAHGTCLRRDGRVPEAEPPQTSLDLTRNWQEWLTQERARQQDEPELERWGYG